MTIDHQFQPPLCRRRGLTTPLHPQKRPGTEIMADTKTAELSAIGVSIWLDDLSRDAYRRRLQSAGAAGLLTTAAPTSGP